MGGAVGVAAMGGTVGLAAMGSGSWGLSASKDGSFRKDWTEDTGVSFGAGDDGAAAAGGGEGTNHASNCASRQAIQALEGEGGVMLLHVATAC